MELTESIERKAEAGFAGAPCSAQIVHHPGCYHFHRCGRPAKWMVGSYGPRCGLHAQGKYFLKLRKPIAPNAELTGDRKQAKPAGGRPG